MEIDVKLGPIRLRLRSWRGAGQGSGADSTNEVTAASAELSSVDVDELRDWLDRRTVEQADDELHSLFVAGWPSERSQRN